MVINESFVRLFFLLYLTAGVALMLFLTVSDRPRSRSKDRKNHPYHGTE